MQEFNILAESNQYITAGAIVFASFLIGVLFQKIVIGKLKKISKKTKWKGDDIIVRGVGKASVIWFILVGIYASLVFIPLGPSEQTLIKQIMLILIVTSIAVVIANTVGGFIRLYSVKGHKALQSTSIFANLTKIFIYILAVLVILQTFGISITPILTALGVGGLAVALALQAPLSNLFSGLHMIASKKFNPGDFVELEKGEKGYIDDISWINTTIRTLSNNFIIIPNSLMASAMMTNYSRPKHELSIPIELSVSYESDLNKVERLANEVAKQIQKTHDAAVPDYEPMARFNTFADSGIGLTVILRAKDFVNQYKLKHDFIKALHSKFQEEGVEIPYPQRTIHMVGEQK